MVIDALATKPFSFWWGNKLYITEAMAILEVEIRMLPFLFSLTISSNPCLKRLYVFSIPSVLPVSSFEANVLAISISS